MFENASFVHVLNHFVRVVIHYERVRDVANSIKKVRHSQDILFFTVNAYKVNNMYNFKITLLPPEVSMLLTRKVTSALSQLFRAKERYLSNKRTTVCSLFTFEVLHAAIF